MSFFTRGSLASRATDSFTAAYSRKAINNLLAAHRVVQ